MDQEDKMKLSENNKENTERNDTILQTIIQIFIVCSYMLLFLTVVFGLIKSIIEKSGVEYDTIDNQLGDSFTINLFFQVCILALIIIVIYSYTIAPLTKRYKIIAFTFSYLFVGYNVICYIQNDDCWLLVKADYTSEFLFDFIETISKSTGAADWIVIAILLFILMF